MLYFENNFLIQKLHFNKPKISFKKHVRHLFFGDSGAFIEQLFFSISKLIELLVMNN